MSLAAVGDVGEHACGQVPVFARDEGEHGLEYDIRNCPGGSTAADLRSERVEP